MASSGRMGQPMRPFCIEVSIYLKVKLSTPAEVRRTLSKIANMLLNNQIDPQRATAITNCCNSVLNCIRIDEQQKKLAELEKLLDEVEANGA